MLKQNVGRRAMCGLLAAVMALTPVVTTPTSAKGMWYDRETGMYYARGRYYHPTLGRFVQRDPNGQALMPANLLRFHAAPPGVYPGMMPRGQYADGMNLYQFVRGNPINRTDPTGMFTYTELAASGAIYGGLTGGTLGWMRSYATYSDEGSMWQQATSAFIGAGIGGFTAMGMGVLAGAIASYGGVSLGTAMASVGMMTAPAAVGLSIKEYQDADTYGEQLMAKIDFGLAFTGLLTSHLAAFHAVLSGSLGGARGFPSFNAFKREMGPAGPARQWHHIVEQNPINEAQFAAEQLHNTRNIVAVDDFVHSQISAYYSSKPPQFNGLTVRQWISTKSFDEQYSHGIDILIRYGGSPPH